MTRSPCWGGDQMTYLSRIRINPRRERSRLLLANPHAMHGAVLNGVPERPTEQRVLWRLDPDDPYQPWLYVLTETRPDWSALVEQAGWPGADGEHAAVAEYTPLLAQVAAGRRFAFRLTANPVQNVPAPQRPTEIQQAKLDRGKPRRSFRIGHSTAAHQLAWFLDRSEQWGFTVPESRTDPSCLEAADGEVPTPAREVRITARQRRSFDKKKSQHPVVLRTVTFEGLLEVTDPVLLTERLLGGIGPAKAYGCGLLTLAPAVGRG